LAVTFKSILEEFNSDLWGHHIKVPVEYGKLFIDGTERRVLCKINDGDFFPAGLIPNKEFGYFINVNKATRDSIHLKSGDEVTVILKEDKSKYGIAVSEEFLAAIEMDPEASDLFHALTPGKQRSLIYMTVMPKRSETRLNKALVILDFLKINRGKLNFRLLMQAFKEAN
jgi:hypothetical protein